MINKLLIVLLGIVISLSPVIEQKVVNMNHQQVGYVEESDTVSGVDTEVVEDTSVTGVVINDCGASDKFVETVNDNFKLVPERVRRILVEWNWKFKISSIDTVKEITGSKGLVLGCTEINNRVVHVSNRPGESDRTILHEVGHAWDICHSYISNSVQFEEIFNAEREAFCRCYRTHKNNTNVQVELFAEMFQVYILNPDLLKENCPMAYEYLDMVINEDLTL